MNIFLKKNFSINDRFLIPSLAVVKLLFLVVFSSEFVPKFFLPFTSYFALFGKNPWQHFWSNASGIEFPYNPLMLYLLSFFVKIGQWLGTSEAIQILLLKLPILFADIVLSILMLQTTKGKNLATLFFLSLSPILLYAAFIHTQLDLIPTALLFSALFLIKKKRLLFSGIVFGLALSTKFHVAAAAPLLIIYIWKNYTFRQAVSFGALAASIYAFFIAPYIYSEGFYRMVLTHPKQMMIFDVCAQLGYVKILVPLFALLILYGRFFTYRKINLDLLDSFIAITFALFIFFIIPAPAWYLWMLPFVALLFIKNYQSNRLTIFLYLALNAAYLLFFLFFYKEPGIHDIIVLGKVIDLKIHHQKLANLSFTLLESILFLVIYFVYKSGIKSNEFYTHRKNLVIGISGDSGTGKSTLMKQFISIFGSKATLIEGDGDHRWERGDQHWQEFTHLNPKANFLHRQAEHILLLKNNTPAWRTDYNHHTGKFDPARKIMPTEFILLSGLHPLYLPKMRQLIDVKIYLDPQPEIKQHWKIVRDMKERGHSKERILEQIKKRTLDTEKYISPQKEFADIVIQFFTQDKFEVGNPDAQFHLSLKITFDSSIKIEPLLQELIQENIPHEWNYADNLHTQELILNEPISSAMLQKLYTELLPNLDDLTPNTIEQLDGFDGFVQFICLMAISESMKESYAG